MADIGWRVGGTGDADLNGQVDILDVLNLVNHFGSRYASRTTRCPWM